MAVSVIDKTSRTLLGQLAQGNDSAWKRFFDTYKVLVYMRGRAWHLNDCDIEDLLITVMQKFSDRQGSFHYDPSTGRFRDYFARLVRNAAVDMLRSRGRHAELTLDDKASELLNNLPADEESDKASLRRDFQARIFAKALQEVKSKVSAKAFQCWTAYRMDHVPINTIAKFLDVHPKTVYYNCAVVWQELKRLAVKLAETEDQGEQFV